MEIYLSLGSNLGDRRANILAAATALENFFKVSGILSPIKEYPSWGFEAPDFLNAAMRFDIPEAGFSKELYARALLREIHRIEDSLGRERHEIYSFEGQRIYHDRTIDIDILYVGDLRLSSEDLTIPHPLIGERDFVKIPLSQVRNFSKDGANS